MSFTPPPPGPYANMGPGAPFPGPPFQGPPFPGEPAAEAPAVGLGRRAGAWLIDFGLVLAAAVALGSLTWWRISALLTDAPGLAQQGVWQVVTSRGDIKGASTDFGTSLWDSVSGYVVQAFAALVLIVFAYQFAALAWKGRTLGKLALDLRVDAHRKPRLSKKQACTRAIAATITDIGLYALACYLLLQGEFFLSILCWVLAVAAFWVNVLPLFLPGRRTLHDQLAGTRVARAHLLRVAAGQALQGGQLAWQGAQRIAEHERVQRLRSSDSAQRVQDLSRGAAGMGRQAAGKSRQALERARQAYTERRDGNEPPPALLPPPPPIAPPRQGPPVPYQAPPQTPQVPYQAPPVPHPAPPEQRIPRPEEQ